MLLICVHKYKPFLRLNVCISRITIVVSWFGGMVVTAKSNDRNILTAHMLVLVNTMLISDYTCIVIIVGSVNCFQKWWNLVTTNSFSNAKSRFKSPFKKQKYCKNIVILNSILTEVGDLLWQVLPSNVATWFFMVVFLDHATFIIMTTTVLFVVAVGGSCSSSSFLLCLWLLYSGQEETAKAINQSCFLQSALIPQELYHATQLLQLMKPKRRTKDFKRLLQKSQYLLWHNT